MYEDIGGMSTLARRFSAAAQRDTECLMRWSLAILLLTPPIGLAATTDPLPSDNPPTDSASPAAEDPILVDLDIPPGLAEFLDEKYPEQAQARAQGPNANDAAEASQAAGTAAPADPTQAPGLADQASGEEGAPQPTPQAQEEAPNDVSQALADESAPFSPAESAEAAVSADVQNLAHSVAPAKRAASSVAAESTLEDPLTALPYQDCFASAADRYQIDDALLMGIAIVESSMDPNAISSANALGLMQIKWPITATHLGITDRQTLFDPCTNIDAGARYLRELLDDLAAFSPQPRRRLALASYRLGPSGFDPNVPLPANAQDYIEKVTAQERLLTAPTEEAVATTAGPVLPCLVQNLRGLAITTHDPTQRSAQVGRWLDARGQGCSALALIQIRNNLPVWLGTALTPDRATQVSDLLEQAINTTADVDTRTPRRRR